MSSDEIEDFRREWLRELDNKENVQNFSEVRHLVNYTCDCALEQVMQKTA